MRARATNIAHTRIFYWKKPDQWDIGTSFVKGQGQRVGFLGIAVATRLDNKIKTLTESCCMSSRTHLAVVIPILQASSGFSVPTIPMWARRSIQAQFFIHEKGRKIVLIMMPNPALWIVGF